MLGNPRDPRQMQRMMRQLGLTTEPIDGVEEVVIRTREKELVFAKPEVTILTVQGTRTYQVVGTPTARARGAGSPAPAGTAAASTGAPAAPTGPPEEDIELVMRQADVSREQAIEALFLARGEPAEAILQLLSRRGRG
ncbi:MAG: nascent polypeptide-associated complex protein [Thermoplasmata archaeon]